MNSLNAILNIILKTLFFSYKSLRVYMYYICKNNIVNILLYYYIRAYLNEKQYSKLRSSVQLIENQLFKCSND